LIHYRPGRSLRIRRSPLPEPPFFVRTTVSPYSYAPAQPVAIDYVQLTASGTARDEVVYCEDPKDMVERERSLDDPVLVDASGPAESAHFAGADVTCGLIEQRHSVTHLVSSEGALGEIPPEVIVVVAAWPPEIPKIRELCREAAGRVAQCGVIVPVVPAITTDINLVNDICAAAVEGGAKFLASVTIEADPGARRAIAAVREGSDDEEEYASLFDFRDDTLLAATERHIAAFATEHGLGTLVPVASSEPFSNIAAAALLTSCATKMLRMERDVEVAWKLQRSAAIVTQLGKPLRWIADAAPLSIVEGLDETSIAILSDWLSAKRPKFVKQIDAAWNVRRDDYR
jgi:hypothetical protein